LHKVINKVRIEEGCVVCDMCTSNCPEVFEIQDNTCIIRPEALDAEFLKPLSELIAETAEECPVDVIKYMTTETESLAVDEVSRRSLVSAAGIGWLSLGGSMLLGGLAVNRFMFPNALEEPDPKLCVGEMGRYTDMPVNSINQDWKPDGIWIVRLESKLIALSTACTHLGCILNWHESEGVFKCPCHGSGFNHEGMHLGGPAPRPLERFKISFDKGKITVDRSKIYRHEKGQWDNPDSFIVL